MKYKEHNLIDIFKKLADNSDNLQLDENNISMACFVAISEMEDKQCMSDVIFNMSMKLQTIIKAVNDLATRTKKADKVKIHPCNPNEKDYCTIPDLTNIYTNISGQAIRKACIEGRLNYKKGTNKNKYLIKREDFETYMMSAKGKKPKSNIRLELNHSCCA